MGRLWTVVKEYWEIEMFKTHSLDWISKLHLNFWKWSGYGCQISCILWEIPCFNLFPASQKEAASETKSLLLYLTTTRQIGRIDCLRHSVNRNYSVFWRDEQQSFHFCSQHFWVVMAITSSSCCIWVWVTFQVDNLTRFLRATAYML